MNKVEKLVNSVTVEQLADAIEKNGYKQGVGTFFRFADSGIMPLGRRKKNLVVETACALGQAALNLCPDNWTLGNLDDLAEGLSTKFGRYGIVEKNDKRSWTLSQIAEYLRNVSRNDASDNSDTTG